MVRILRRSWRGPGSWAKGEEDLPAPSDLPLFHSLTPLLLPLHLSWFVPHLNLESELILSHTYHPLTPSKRNKTLSKACNDRFLNRRAWMTARPVGKRRIVPRRRSCWYTFSWLVLSKKSETMMWQEIGRAVPAYTIPGSRLLRGRGVSIFPEPVMEGFSWVWWGSAVVRGTMEDHQHGGCSSVRGRSWWRGICGWMGRQNERKSGEGRSVL